MEIQLSKEVLSHFCCGNCKQWWTIGDWVATSNLMVCPRCGEVGEVAISEESWQKYFGDSDE
jgi:hypothetical protein